MKCGKPAKISYVWNGKVHYSCEEHFRQLQILCSHMGWPLTASLVDGSESCSQEVDAEDGGKEDEDD